MIKVHLLLLFSSDTELFQVDQMMVKLGRNMLFGGNLLKFEQIFDDVILNLIL